MITHILDTDTLTLFERQSPKVMTVVASRPAGSTVITAVTVEEQINGRIRFIRSARSPADQEQASRSLITTVNFLG